jgi:poly-gamma-glutamate synthesis protein (capsule biosynthesis protein)
MAEDIRRLKDDVHHVILSLHWGEERFRFPAPEQIEQARRFAEAGASLIIGHHPHVIQGMETWKGVPIVYSLGNFVASEVGYASGDRLTWTRRERTGCLLLADVTASDVRNLQQIPTYDAGLSVNIDRSSYGHKIIRRAHDALVRGVTPQRYRREYLWVKTVKPILEHLRWSQLRRLRPSQIRKAFAGIRRARKAE